LVCITGEALDEGFQCLRRGRRQLNGNKY
jgi:hypothetical protein